MCTAKVSCDTAKCLVDVMVLGASRVSMCKAPASAVGEESWEGGGFWGGLR